MRAGLRGLVAAAAVFAAVVATPPADAAPGTMLLPFQDGESWTVCQGYFGAASHSESYSLDLTLDPNSAGEQGCIGDANAGANQEVVAPAAGTVRLFVAGAEDGMCLTFDEGGSVALAHVRPDSRVGGAVTAGQVIGITSAAGQWHNRGYAHIHIDFYPAGDCAGGTAPFDDAHGSRFAACAPNMPDQGGGRTNQYSGTVLKRCDESPPPPPPPPPEPGAGPRGCLHAPGPSNRFQSTRIHFEPGTYTGYRFDANWNVTQTKAGSVSSGSHAHSSRRGTPFHNGVTYFLMNDGYWAGYWIRETAKIFETYPDSCTLRFEAGSVVGYKFDVNGNATASKSGSISPYSYAHGAGWARINGVPYFYVADGHWAGYWVRESARIYEYWSPTRKIHFDPGTYVGYKFDAAGNVTASKSGTVGSSQAQTWGRALVNRKPYLYVTNGIWAGYWIADSAVSYEAFAAEHGVHFDGGTHTGYKFDRNGNVTATKTSTLGGNSSAPAIARAVVNGQLYLRIVAGIWNGYWIPETRGSYLY